MKQVVDAMVLHHTFLRQRLEAIHHFRVQHEKLRAVVTEVLENEKQETTNQAVREVEEAPINLFAGVDLLDTSPKGNAAFDAALEKYDRKIDSIEEQLAKLLRDKLTSCQVCTNPKHSKTPCSIFFQRVFTQISVLFQFFLSPL